MNIKGIIFDFGFTLYYFEDVSLEKYFECFRQGLIKSIEFLKDKNILSNDNAIKTKFMRLFKKKRMYFFSKSMKTKNEYPTTFIFQKVLEQMVEKNLVESIESVDEEMYKELADLFHTIEEKEWKPFKETRETLKKLRDLNKFKIGLLSNHPHHLTIKNILKKHDLIQFFDAVVTSAKYGKRKPHPEIFHHTLKKMGLNSDDANYCLMCGDEYADIIGGHRAGLKTILFEREFTFPFEKEIKISDTLRINNISEVLKHLG